MFTYVAYCICNLRQVKGQNRQSFLRCTAKEAGKVINNTPDAVTGPALSNTPEMSIFASQHPYMSDRCSWSWYGKTFCHFYISSKNVADRNAPLAVWDWKVWIFFKFFVPRTVQLYVFADLALKVTRETRKGHSLLAIA